MVDGGSGITVEPEAAGGGEEAEAPLSGRGATTMRFIARSEACVGCGKKALWKHALDAVIAGARLG